MNERSQIIISVLTKIANMPASDARQFMKTLDENDAILINTFCNYVADLTKARMDAGN